jgi:aspartokinase/homoserine dehydrogenase 1
VHKFGGASLRDALAIRRVIEIVSGVPGPRVVVVSAMAGVTDALLDLGARAVAGDAAAARDAAEALEGRHRAAVRALVPAPARRVLDGVVRDAFLELVRLTDSLAVLREMTPRTRDHIVARGERLSARIVTAALQAQRVRAHYVDAVDLVKTDGRFGDAFPDLAATDRQVRRLLGPLLRQGIAPVVPGFLGAAPSGETATLGRGGSDLSAVVVSRGIGAREVSLWKDVPGFLTADPRVVPDARVVDWLHPREAAELAYYGAKVLHPRALIPAQGRGIVVKVRSVVDPAVPGTEVSSRRKGDGRPVKALAAVPAQAIVTVEGNGMLGVPGVAERTFAALHAAGISVSFISQASSEHSICFTVPSAFGAVSADRVREAFAREIARGEIDGVRVRDGVATLAVVGLGMAGTRGLAARVFGALADGGVNVMAIAQGSSELNISCVIDDREAGDAQRVIHRAFQLDRVGGGRVEPRTRTDLVLLGYGQIGQRLAALASRGRRAGVELRVVAVIDRSGIVFEPRGLGARRLAELSATKAAGRTLATSRSGRTMPAAEAVALVSGHALQRPILVDVTAEDTTAALQTALEHGFDVVLANKRPLAGPLAGADALWRLARSRGRRLLHEATVGAGLPILDTFDKLVESGDRVRRIEGCLSGTLGFLFSEMGRGRRFSEVVGEAKRRGFTEPDPRDDLSGADVARKTLILARLLGFRGELSAIEVESLVPAAARRLTRDQFLARLEEWDAEWAARVEAVAARGLALRYIARATARSARVRLAAVGPESPFSALRGTDNQVVFVSDRYRDQPLVVTGPGAGPEVTAAGVMNDVLSIARRAR